MNSGSSSDIRAAATNGVRIERVSKHFGEVRAVDDISLDIADGEFVSILGPSGCGKTTLLRMLAGLEEPTSGDIFIGTRRVNETPPSRRDIAMVFQTYALYPHMTVARNIEYPLRKRKVPKDERASKIAKVAKQLELEPLLARKPAELSGGQQQRVALGRALVRDPAVFLLDEPLSNLDAKLRAHMRAELTLLRKSIARTMIYVTHDQLEAMTMSDRIAVLCNGRVQQFAPPRTVYAEPANEFVASFIGTPAMNIVSGSVQASTTVVCAGWQFAFSSHERLDDQPVRAGFRPEDILFDEGGEQAVVMVVEPTGHELIVMLDMHGDEIIARRPPDSELQPGDTVTVRPRPDRVHLFHAQTGARLNSMQVEQRSNG